MPLGQRIAARRRALHLTQGDLADMLHVSRSTVAMWESGGNGLTLPAMERLVEILHVPAIYLLRTPLVCPEG